MKDALSAYTPPTTHRMHTLIEMSSGVRWSPGLSRLPAPMHRATATLVGFMLMRRHGDVCQSGRSCPASCDNEQSRVSWMRAKVAPRAALKRLVRSRDALEQIGAMGGAGAGFITGAGGEGVHSIPPLWYVGAVGDGEETATSSLHDV